MGQRRWVESLTVAGLGLVLGMQLPGLWPVIGQSSPGTESVKRKPDDNTSGNRDSQATGASGFSSRKSQEHHLRVLGRFYGIEPELEKPDKTGDTATSLSASARKKIIDRVLKSSQQGSRIRFLIASIPDPRDSHLSNFTDDFLEAIQRGIQKSGYQFDRHWLPWPVKARGETDQVENPIYRQEPGVLLFRKGSAVQSMLDSDLLLILLVGETPTSGVHKPALMRALDAVMELSGSGEIRFIGPSFSGSAVSLRMALSEWQSSGSAPLPSVNALRSGEKPGPGAKAEHSPGATVKLFFISGSATSPSNPRLLNFELPPLNAGGYGIKAEFQPLVYADDLLKDVFFQRYLPDFNIDISEVAIISEASAYGSPFLGTQSGPAAAAKIPALEASYPMHVSQLRAAYERDERLRAGAAKVPWKEKAVLLPLSEEAAERADDLPSYSPGQTANVAELELASVLDTIERQKVRYVILAGTDTRDKLFLARLIRNYAPNAQLITFESDILYAHPELISDLNGMLVVSTYPLFPATRELLQFPNGAVEGVYNAVLAALNPPVTPYSRQTWESGQTPPVYVSSVGRNRLWPLRFYPQKAGMDLAGQLPISHPISFWVLLALLTLLCILHVSNYPPGTRPAVCKPARGVSGYFFSVDWRPDLTSSSGDDGFEWLAYRAYVLSYLSVLLILYLVIVTIGLLPAIIGLKSAGSLGSLGTSVADASLFVAAFLVVWALAGIWLDSAGLLGQGIARKRFKRHLPWNGRAAAIAALAIVSIGVLTLILITRPVHHLLYERATTLGSGLSPIVPLFFLGVGICYWMRSQLWRHAFADQLKQLNPFPQTPPRDSDLSHSRSSVLECLSSWNCGTSPVIAIGVMVLLAILPVVGVGYRVFATFEYRWFNLLAFFLTLILLLCVIRSGLRFLSTWYQFRRLLRRLAWHPIAEAFDRLPRKLSRMLSLQFSARPPSVTELGLSVDQLALISNHFNTMVSQDPTGIFSEQDRKGIETVLGRTADIKETFERELTSATRRKLRTSSWCSDTQKKLFLLSAELMQNLWLHWEKRPGKSLLPEAGPASVLLNVDSATLYRRAVPASPQFWFRLVEDFSALQITFFASCVFNHLKNLLICTTVGGILLILALTSYPFQQQHVLVSVIWIALAILVSMVLTVFVQMDRNEVLSRIANTEPNRLSLDRRFLSQVFTYAVLPVVTFLAAQFPALSRFLFSWVSPTFNFF